MSVAVAAQRPLASRRVGIGFIVVALGLALIAGYAANSYLAGERSKVAAPLRDVWVASHAIAAGTLVGAADLTIARIPVPDAMRALYLGPAAPSGAGGTATTAGPTGVAAKAIPQGEPLTQGDLLAASSADSVAPLVPPTVQVAGKAEAVAGGLNVPIGAFVAPPPKFTVGDRVDIWAETVAKGGQATSTQVVLEDIAVIAFTGSAQSPRGIVFAVTPEQLDRYLFFASTGSPMILTVRSSEAK
ncbi:MAG: hypothetical protein KGJ98_12505 [Chloroflexota bacterium]|nr:hypothetical protein [Chloroflexota bacterium]